MASIPNLRRALNDATEDVTRQARDRGGFKAVLLLHDWLIGRFTYGELPDGLAHEAAGPLLHGVGVCDGVSKAFAWLCRRAGLRCKVVVGSARNRASLTGGAFEPHAWNLVCIEGPDGVPAWFHVDVTFDAAFTTTTMRRDYLCLGDDDISRDHRFSRWGLPRCPQSWGFHEHAGRFADTRSALLRMAREAGHRGERTLVFQLPFLEGTDEAFLARMGTEAARELAGAAPRPRAFTLTCNPFQMVCQVDLKP